MTSIPPRDSAPPAGDGGGAGADDRTRDEHIPVFGARSRAKKLAAELTELQARVGRFGVLSVVELDERRRELQAETAELAANLAREHSEAATAVQEEINRARAQAEGAISALRTEREGLAANLEREHAQAAALITRETSRARAEAEAATGTLRAEVVEAETRLEVLREDLVVTEDALILQEVGIYEYRHPLSDAVAYQAEIKRLQDQIKAMARQDGGAVLAATGWTVNGSLPKGRAMVRDYSKLVLRAYNAEADNLVRALKPYKLTSAVERLAKIALTIERLGKTMDIRISDAYHALRIKELELTADYLEKRAEERERESADRERLKEERRVQQELARERARLEKEHEHYSNVIRRLVEQGGPDAAAAHRETLAQIERAIQDVDYRVANVRAGYVYVISNLGAFGQRMIKVGLTRRIDPTERVRELGDASVPFRYDTHALFFSPDAVGLEAQLHARLADRRVNWVNKRREFFYATPEEAKRHLLDLAGELLEFTDEPEALEYRQSLNHAMLSEEAVGPDSDSRLGSGRGRPDRQEATALHVAGASPQAESRGLHDPTEG
jgi:hypothetical protein